MDQVELKEYLIKLREDAQTNIFKHTEYNFNDPTTLSKMNLRAFFTLHRMAHPNLNNILREKGFLSLANCSPHIMDTLNKIIHHLSKEVSTPYLKHEYIDVHIANSLKEERKDHLFGKTINQKHIMVTLDRKMLNTPEVFNDLLQAGMTIARINCAHDDLTVWKKMIQSLKMAEETYHARGVRNNSTCKIFIDLPGPKIRIGQIVPSKNKKGMTDSFIKIKKNDMLRIYKNDKYIGIPKTDNVPASVGVTLPKALRNVRIGDRVYIDDGKIVAKVLSNTEEYIETKILLTRKKEETIYPENGINFPDSLVHLNVPTVSESDLKILKSMYKDIDLVGISYINHPKDIQIVKHQLEMLTEDKKGIIAKIETKNAILSLSKIIMEGLNYGLFGVMIARGDLVIEIGLKQFLSAQEGILEICHAAHIPVIWATGVLENMNKKNIPSIPELTDVHAGLRADCIMFNKGPYVPNSIEFLQKLNEINQDPQFHVRNSLVSFVQYDF
ncbi:pyruvate kinase [Fredinandcohnia sp. QZ13]|uniref:pyruvate kinase n=1 Tax=Fredinandcohnia sp. QZ13 TaxID=3073144 RepID=UPI0028535697|nr:pyruvate kinase [Fredinandcohnia sp. QZ13]MDR4886957.1 pyruvate kinase [Fredinandcohnia sp. QZ13]